MRIQLRLVIVACAITLCFAGQDTSVCSFGDQKPVGAAKPFPTVPDVFHAQIQMNIAANKTIRSLYEVFDSPNNRAILVETMSTGDYQNISLTGYDIYNFYTNQIVEIIKLPDGSSHCEASQLDGKGVDTFIFGNDASSASGFTAQTAFMINPSFPPVYKGPKTLSNGVSTETWLDCHYIPVLDATVTAEWYFTDSTWSTSLGVTQIPIMLKIKGKLYANNPQGRVVDHSYTFSGFGDFITDQMQTYFEVPQGTVCPFLKDYGTATAHTMPKVAQNGFFKFRAEFVQQTDATSGIITDINEYYDNTMMLSRFDYTPQGMLTSFFDFGAAVPLTEVHDFLTGLAYIIDKNNGNCTVKKLGESANFDVTSGDARHVRMKTVNEFFGLDGTKGSRMNWTYTGPRKLRDIQADVYVAEGLGYPPGSPPDTKSIWEIAFTARSYIDVASTAADLQVQEPMRLWIKIPALDYEMSYNIYDFDEEEPDAWTFGVSECYTDDQKTNLNFKLPGDQAALMESNRKEFTYWLLIDIIGYMDLSPIRVVNLEWFMDDDDSNIFVQFQVLDPPTMLGSTNDQLPASYLNPTADAVNLLIAAVNGGKFVVETGSLSDDSIVPVIAVTGSVRQGKVVNKTVKVHDVKLDAGAFAGVAIGFLVVGVLIGVLIIFIVNKVKGGSVPNLTMSFSPKTFSNES